VSQWVVQALRLQWVLSGVGTSKSGGSTGKAIRAIIFFSLTEVLQFFLNVTMHSTPKPPNFSLKLFLDSLKFSLFLVHFSFEKSK